MVLIASRDRRFILLSSSESHPQISQLYHSHTTSPDQLKEQSYAMEVVQPVASSSTSSRRNLLHIPEVTYPNEGQPQPAFNYRSVAGQDPVICIDNGMCIESSYYLC